MKPLDEMLKRAEWAYDRVRWLEKRHPKAAKRRRIIKKWKNKYDSNYHWLIYKTNPFLESIKDENIGLHAKES